MKEVLQYLNIAAVFVGFAVFAWWVDRHEHRRPQSKTPSNGSPPVIEHRQYRDEHEESRMASTF